MEVILSNRWYGKAFLKSVFPLKKLGETHRADMELLFNEKKELKSPSGTTEPQY